MIFQEKSFLCYIISIDQISLSLFVIVFIRSKPDIKGLVISDHCYLYSVYADDTTFFLQDTFFIKHMVEAFYLFSSFSGLEPNLKKSETAGIGALKGVQVAVCGLRCIDLNNDTLKILGTHFSYNEKLKEENNFL